MAIAYLNEGAVSFAAANWSDATGFANAATLVANRPAGSGGIQAGLDQSALTGINYLDFIGDWAGNVGGAGGSLIVDADAADTVTTTAGTTGANVPISRVRWWGRSGDIYYTAGNDATTDVCNVFQCWVGTSFLTGGDFKRIHSEGSAFVRFYSAATAHASARWFLGGQGSFIDTHASDALVTTVLTEGTHTVKRTMGTIYVLSGATLIVDCAALNGTAIYCCGGVVKLINFGTLTDFFGWAGTLDCGSLARAAVFTNCELCPKLTIIPSNLLDYGTKTYVGTGPKGI